MPLDYEQPVSLTFDPATRGILTSRETREQIRDWLLELVLSSAHLDANQIADATFEAPILRTSDAGTIGDLQYGPSRYAVLPANSMLVLVPADFRSEQRSDTLATSADKYVVRKGARPTTIYVVQYCIQENEDLSLSEKWQVSLRRLPNIDGRRIFTPEFGYVTSEITSAAQLATFLASVNDLASVSVGAKGITVSGRAYRARAYSHLTNEHIATIWQAYGQIEMAQDRENARYQSFISNLADQELAEISGTRPNLFGLRAPGNGFRLDPRSSGGLGDLHTRSEEAVSELRQAVHKRIHEAIQEIEKERRTCNLAIGVSELRNKANKTLPEERALFLWNAVQKFHDAPSEQERSLVRGALGFSLDPAFRFKELEDSFARYVGDHSRPLAAALAEHEDAIVADIRRGQEQLLRCYLRESTSYIDDEATRLGVLRAAYAAIFDRASYQTARYDGGLAGTEVGQVLFYTDLLAKLYGMDFDGTATQAYGERIPDWIPAAFQIPDPVHREQDQQVPETRMWFGIRNDSFQVEGATVNFGPTATRVFALSHGIADEEEEVQPSSINEKWVSFFNNYYDEIAESETRYDELNQIIKWSLALDVVYKHKPVGLPLFAALEREPVRRDLWFPNWVRDNIPNAENLSWRACFETGAKEQLPGTVETVQVFHNGWAGAPKNWCVGPVRDDIWDIQTFAIRGGVSLPRFEQLAKRANPAAFAAHPNAWRAGVIEDSVSVSPLRMYARFAHEYGYQREFEIVYSPDGLTARIMRSAKALEQNRDGTLVSSTHPVLYRGPGLELRPTTFEDTVQVGRDHVTLTVDATSGDGQVGRVSFETSNDHFSVTYEPLSRDMANSIAVTLSQVPRQNWAARLAGDVRIVAVVEPDKNHLFTKLRTGEWIEYDRQPRLGAVGLPEGWQARNAMVPRTPLEYMLRWPKASTSEINLPDDLQGNVVLVRQVDQMAVSERLSSLPALDIQRRPRDDFGVIVQIRGPPNQPPPPNGPGLAFGGEEDPFRGWFTSAGGNGAYLPTGGRKVPLDDLVKVFSGNLDALRTTKNTEVISLVPDSKKTLPKSVPTRTAELREVLDGGLRNAPDETLEAIARIRREYRDDIRAASEANAPEIADQLRRGFRAAFRPTPDELISDADASLRARGQEVDREVIELMRSAANSDDFGLSLSHSTRAAMEHADAEALNKAIMQEHLFMSEAVQERLSTGLEPSVTDDETGIDIKVAQPRRLRKLAQSDIAQARLIYLDERLKQGRFTEPELVTLLGRDLLAVEIHDPDLKVVSGLMNAVPDQITLGPQWVFKLAYSKSERPTFTDTAHADADWKAYESFAGQGGGGAFCCAAGVTGSSYGSPGQTVGGTVLVLTTDDAIAEHLCRVRDEESPAPEHHAAAARSKKYCAMLPPPT
jgi:hypothetical protein